MVHSARPPSTSRSSFMSSGRKGARCTAAASGERKEHLLQRRPSARMAQLVERAGAPQAAVGEQHEAVADPLGIGQLVDGENERAALPATSRRQPKIAAGL